MNNTPKISNLDKIERIENAVIGIADIVSERLMVDLENPDNLADSIPAYRLPEMLLNTLTLWEKLDKIKTSEMKRKEVSKPVVAGSLSNVPTHVLLSYVEIDDDNDLLSFMRGSTNSTDFDDDDTEQDD